jgi:hypothetical protein
MISTDTGQNFFSVLLLATERFKAQNPISLSFGLFKAITSIPANGVSVNPPETVQELAKILPDDIFHRSPLRLELLLSVDGLSRPSVNIINVFTMNRN